MEEVDTFCTTEYSLPGSQDLGRESGDVKLEGRGGGAAIASSEQGDSVPRESESPASRVPAIGAPKAANITLEMLSSGGYYDMPMSKVAQLLGRTEGSFQRICRSLGILRWPYLVRKSLQEIMAKTEEYLDDGIQEDGMTKAEVLRTLQAHMDDIKGISGNGMDKATKQYRQYIFKVNHKLARKSSKQGQPPERPNMKVKGMLRAASKIQKTLRPSNRQISEPTSLSRCPSGAASCGRGGGGPASEDLASSGTEGSQPTRPTPRHFRDLPSSLAIQPVGSGDPASGTDIVARMATSAAVHKRLKPSTSEEYRRICLQDDQELLRLCLEMDSHLEAAQKALAMRVPSSPPKPPTPLAGANAFLAHVMHASLPPAHLLTHPAWPQLPLGRGVAFRGLSGGGLGFLPPQAGGLLGRQPYERCL